MQRPEPGRTPLNEAPQAVQTNAATSVVIVLFIGGPSQRTLPQQMFDGIRDTIDPSILAMSSILVVVSLMFMATIGMLSRKPARTA